MGKGFDQHGYSRTTGQFDIEPWATLAITKQAMRIGVDNLSTMAGNVVLYASARKEAPMAVIRDQHLGADITWRWAIDGDQCRNRKAFQVRKFAQQERTDIVGDAFVAPISQSRFPSSQARVK
jgi:hypothetical protein